MRDILITARVVDFQLRSSSIAKSESKFGIAHDSLTVIRNGSVVVAFTRISDAPVEIGTRFLGIELDGLVVIGNGSILVAFFRISDAPVYKGVSSVGIELDGLVVVGYGLVGVAFSFINEAPVVKGVNALGIEFEWPRCSRLLLGRCRPFSNN